MATLKLDKKEAAEMRAFYQTELEKAISRLEHIKNVLDKLGDNGSGISIKISGRALSHETKPTELSKSTNQKKLKPGPESVWDKMVLKKLKSVDRPLTYEELTDEIMESQNIPKERRKRTKQSIINVTFRLRKRDEKIDTFSAGSREKYLALSSWFDSSGEIKAVYKSKVTDSAEQASSGKKNSSAKATAKKKKAGSSKKRKTAKS